jgi:arginase
MDKTTQVTLIGFPFDENSSFMRGAAEAPPLIRQALHSDSSNLWTEWGLNLGEPGIMGDAGDLDRGSPRPHEEIRRSVEGLLSRQQAPICLGGDHSITFPIIEAFARAYPHLTIVQFDAHPDLYDEFQGNRFSHGSPFARIMEQQLVGRLVQVGLRAITGEQRRQARNFRVESVEMRDWDQIFELAFETPVYVSVDIDVLDPAFVPGTSHYEPGGCTTRQLVEALRSLRADIVGADIVEFNPRRDLNGMTAMVCAKIVKELTAAMRGGGPVALGT